MTGAEAGRRRWLLALAALYVAGTAIRVHNAFAYWPNFGFDAPFNWQYVHDLTRSWALPHPESHWSAARPPLFFYLAGALARVFGPRLEPSVHAIRLVSSLIGVASIGLIAALLWREPRDGPRRAFLASALLLFLPAQLMLSAMLNEEVLVASFTTAALALQVVDRRRGDAGRAAWLRAAGIGVLGGLAFLTKLTGCLVVVAACAVIAFDGIRSGRWRRALGRAALLAAVALVVGGWFYARSLALYGYLYPRGLPTHEIMFTMPPGERTLSDYLRVPLATFSNPRVDAPELLHSVWGSTHATLWFDGQRHFVPRDAPNARRIGASITLLALLPVAAFVLGALRGARLAFTDARSADLPLLALTALTLAGYVLYTWQNPWYATLKGSTLLGLQLPFGWWASERLAAWTRGPRWRAALVWLDVALLLAAVALAFTFGHTLLWEMVRGRDMPGLPWLPGQP